MPAAKGKTMVPTAKTIPELQQAADATGRIEQQAWETLQAARQTGDQIRIRPARKAYRKANARHKASLKALLRALTQPRPLTA
jgi:hypothetical protein